MVYKRRSISNIAAAAATATWAVPHLVGVDSDHIAACAVAAVHATAPDNAPGLAAQAARRAGADGALCTAIAAGVAAATAGWEFKVVQKASVAAFSAFPTPTDITRNESEDYAAAVAAKVAEAVNAVSSRYPAVEAAAAAAYEVHSFIHPLPPTPEGSADDVVHEAAAVAAAKAAGVAAKATKGPAGASIDGLATDDTVRDDGNNRARDGTGKEAKTTDGLDCLCYAAQAAAKAAASRGATAQSAVAAAIQAATPANAPASANQPDRGEATAIAISCAVGCLDWDSSVTSLGACGKEWLEVIPESHELTYKKLETIMALDTFLAGFLLFSLTGEFSSDDSGNSNPPGEEILQIILQAFTFTVFLAATMSAAVFMVLTGDKHILSSNDVRIPAYLSAVGFLLLLVTVSDAIYIELGEGVYNGDDYHALYWVTIAVGGVLQLFGVFSGVFKVGAANASIRSMLHGSKYKPSRTCLPTCSKVGEWNGWKANA